MTPRPEHNFNLIHYLSILNLQLQKAQTFVQLAKMDVMWCTKLLLCYAPLQIVRLKFQGLQHSLVLKEDQEPKLIFTNINLLLLFTILVQFNACQVFQMYSIHLLAYIWLSSVKHNTFYNILAENCCRKKLQKPTFGAKCVHYKLEHAFVLSLIPSHVYFFFFF